MAQILREELERLLPKTALKERKEKVAGEANDCVMCILTVLLYKENR